MIHVVACALLVAPNLVPFKSERPEREVFKGYFAKKHQGFTLYVSRMAWERSDEERGRPLRVVTRELDRICDALPDALLASLRKSPLWVEWDHSIPGRTHGHVVLFSTDAEALAADGIDPRKAGCLCVISLKTAFEKRADGTRNTLLRYYAKGVYAFGGVDAAVVGSAHKQAVAKGLYEGVLHADGVKRDGRATLDAVEYFAELTCAYLDHIDYAPTNAKGLREYDSVGYELMQKVYGPLDKIAALKKGRDPKRP